MLRLKMKVENEATKELVTLAHTASIPFPPEKMNEPAFLAMFQSQVVSTLAIANACDKPFVDPNHIDNKASTELRQFAAMIDSGKYVTSYESQTDPATGKQRLILTLDPKKI